MVFFNNTPTDIQKVLNKITQKRLSKELAAKGYPFPSNPNKYTIIASNNKATLCYYYGSKPTVILELLPMELPTDNWVLHL